MSTDHISAPEQLFHLSSLIDRLRDSAEKLLDHPSTEAVTMLTQRYNTVRQALPATVDDDAATLLATHTDALARGTDIATAYVAISQLATAVDTLLTAPAFLLRRRVAHLQFDQMAHSLDRGENPKADADGLADLLTSPAISSDGTGAYL